MYNENTREKSPFEENTRTKKAAAVQDRGNKASRLLITPRKKLRYNFLVPKTQSGFTTKRAI